MLVNRLKSALIATTGAGALLLGLASPASAGPLVFNPSATNPGCTDAGGGACGALGASTAFNTTKAGLFFTSDLRIEGAINAAGAHNVSEVGSFSFRNWGSAVPPLSNLHGLLLEYNIYGTFSITGSGTWDGNGKFIQNIPGPASINLYANPSCADNTACAPVFTQATQTAGINFGVQIPTAVIRPDDFLLAIGAILGFTGSGAPQATFSAGCTAIPCDNGQNLGALLHLTPAAGTSGLLGAWQNVDSLGINLSVTSNNGSSGTELTAFQDGGDGCPVAVCSYLRTHADFYTDPASAGDGSVTFDVVGVPEPMTLGLFGFGLLGLGFMVRRNNNTSKTS